MTRVINTVIVEDDPMVAQINRKYAEMTDDVIVRKVCAEPKEALEYLKEHSADLLIVDEYMPGMNGLDLLEEIKRAGYQGGSIMVTAANDRTTVERALKLGVIDYLVKPFTYERFSQAMDRFRRRHELLNTEENLTQKQIDSLIFAEQTRQEEYTKGINTETLRKLEDYLVSIGPESMSSDEIAQATGFSNVTVRRYMNYLVEKGKAECVTDYKTGGRPRLHYKALQ